MAELNSNETLWFYCSLDSPSDYKKNYYLERMVGGTMGSNSIFITALRYLKGEYAECTNVPSAQRDDEMCSE